ncbi:MAG: cytidine deaminase [Candidatus Aenigmarchaeota archaeon]|nr:cytidine deaminase [Candidatus Aenigmarchaeota archaeon]
MEISNEELIKKAAEVAKLKKVSEDVRIGDVGCALVTDNGNIHLGVSIHACCGIGFCGEHSAIASMVTNKEYKIKKIVATTGDGTILPPCGRCREMIYEINEENLDTEIIVEKDKTVRLKELLPRRWQETWDLES